VAADYGLDAPGVVRTFALLGGASAALAALFAGLGLSDLAISGVICAVMFLATVGLMWRSSRRGKLVERDRLLDGLALRGDETLLDVGCGRGLLLVGAARRLPDGLAVGVDVWSARDQAGNSREATLRAAQAEGVGDRVEVVDGDMRALPFDDASFDCVISSIAIHNLAEEADRETACREIVRVLRPGGRVAILDLRATHAYALAFEDFGLVDVERSGLRWQMYPPVRLVTGRKPA
jgi:SAM-dependent methyltransferase